MFVWDEEGRLRDLTRQTSSAHKCLCTPLFLFVPRRERRRGITNEGKLQRELRVFLWEPFISQLFITALSESQWPTALWGESFRKRGQVLSHQCQNRSESQKMNVGTFFSPFQNSQNYSSAQPSDCCRVVRAEANTPKILSLRIKVDLDASAWLKK